ncbi:MAG: DUF2341 domain-containing protein [Fibrobacter sp.]|nr:DUF2341 domain-containing protein [Fibrobacter sp.]
MKNLKFLAVVCFLLAVGVSCTQTVISGGGGSEVEVIGMVLDTSGNAAPFTQVKLIPKDYDPSSGTVADSLIDTSDSRGCYKFMVLPGEYNVQALQLENLTRSLVTGLNVEGSSFSVESATLRKPGAVEFVFSDNTKKDGYVMIPGTDIYKRVPGGSSEVLLDSVPAAVIPQIRYVQENRVIVEENDVAVSSSDTARFINPEWKYQREIGFNTTVSGADIDIDIYNFAVLVRLSSDNFDFTQAMSFGEDIRFTTLSGNQLPYEIEKWDATGREAVVWVKIDTIFGNDNTQSILMHWGNPAAESQSDGRMVFDTVSGFAGVWHLGNDNEGVFSDATANMYHGNSTENSRPAVGDGAIGKGCVFDGKDDFITMPNTADSKLNFPDSGYYSVSAWVFIDSLTGSSRCIVSKGYEQYYMRLTYFPGGVPSWEFVEFDDIVSWQASLTPAQSGEWVFLTGVRNGNRQLLYRNGELVDSTTDEWPQDVERKTSNDLLIGKFAELVIFPTIDGYCYYKGTIDEVRIMSVSQEPQWIRLCYMNQRKDDKLVEFR